MKSDECDHTSRSRADLSIESTLDWQSEEPCPADEFVLPIEGCTHSSWRPPLTPSKVSEARSTSGSTTELAPSTPDDVDRQSEERQLADEFRTPSNSYYPPSLRPPLTPPSLLPIISLSTAGQANDTSGALVTSSYDICSEEQAFADDCLEAPECCTPTSFRAPITPRAVEDSRDSDMAKSLQMERSMQSMQTSDSRRSDALVSDIYACTSNTRVTTANHSDSDGDGESPLCATLSLFKICRHASDATLRSSTAITYIGGQWKSFAKVLSLEGLHRGVRIPTLTRNFGAIFREGTAVVVRGEKLDDLRRQAAWYTKSGPPMNEDEALSGFVSHSWATSGSQKGMALAMYFFNGRASIAMFFFLVWFGVPTLVGMKSADAEDETIFIAMTFVVLGSYISYFLLLVFGDRVPGFLYGLANQRYFLDICCISQNADEKMKGVYHLAEYVMVSKKVIVCYTERYTTRLWCVFEMAVFFARLRNMSQLPPRLSNKTGITRQSVVSQRSWVKIAMHHKDAAEFVFLPLFLPPIAIGISISLQACLFVGLAYFITQWQVCAIVLVCCMVVALLFLGFGARKLYIAAVKMHQDFKNFSLERAQCFSEEDRTMIYESINSFWAPDGKADDSSGLEEFEHFVREDIAEFIWENFATPINSLRCLFATSGLPLIQSLLVLMSLGALLPFLMTAFAMDAFIGDAFGKAKGPLLPLSRRATLKRVTTWTLMVAMGAISAIHCYGYVVEPMVVLPDDLRFKINTEDLEYPKELIDDFVQNVLVPPDFSIDASGGLWIFSSIFGLLAILFWTLAFNAIFLRRHAVLSVPQSPIPDALARLSVSKFAMYCKDWLSYIRSIQPGSDMYWRRIAMIELVEFGLQFLKLASYSGKDLISGESFPAQDDKVVILHTCALCLDVFCIGLCIFFRATFAAIVSEIFVDVLYSIAPLVALGAFFEPAAWYQLRDDDMQMLYFFATIFPMLRMLSSLSKLDQINLQNFSTTDQESSVALSKSSIRSSTASGASDLSDVITQASKAGLANLISTTGAQGRKKGALPIFELLLRLLIIIGLLAWVLPAMNNPCEKLKGSATWRCDWVTHPIFESPPCDCKLLSGHTFQVTADGSVNCSLEEIYPILEVATSVEYLFTRSNPILPSCVFDEDRLHRFDPQWLKHTRALQFQSSLLTSNRFPSALAEARKLRSLQIYLTQIDELPDWFSNLESLQTFRLVMGQLFAYPVVLESLPDLQLVELDGNPVCRDSGAVATMQRRFVHMSCDVGRPTAMSVADTNESFRNLTNSSNLTRCAQDDGVWAILADSAAGFCEGDATTACTDMCTTTLSLLITLDTREPKGAFDMVEINTDAFQALLKAWRPIDDSRNLLRSSGHLGCSLEAIGCQVDDHLQRGLNESQMWLSTFSRLVSSVVNPADISDCSECSGTAWLPYYSLELQDPSDPTKRKS